MFFRTSRRQRSSGSRSFSAHPLRHDPGLRSLRVEPLESRRLLSASDLDLSFGGDGIVTTEFYAKNRLFPIGTANRFWLRNAAHGKCCSLGELVPWVHVLAGSVPAAIGALAGFKATRTLSSNGRRSTSSLNGSQ